jgi:hypothetical protein
MDEWITMSSRCLHEPHQKKIDIFGFSEAPWSLRSNESSSKAIGSSYKRIWPNHRRLHVLKFWTATVLMWNSYNSLIRTPIKMNEYLFER